MIRKDFFSVKSAYKVARDLEAFSSLNGNPSSSQGSSDTGQNQWKKLWSLPLPNKVLHFWWRLATNSLPLRINQKKRGMKVDTRCPLCWRLDEDGGHVFLKCKMVKPIWRQLQLEDIRTKLGECQDAMSVLEAMLNLNEAEKITTCCLMWMWWAERNKANSGNKFRNSQQVVSSILTHVLEYMERGNKNHVKKNFDSSKWALPLCS